MMGVVADSLSREGSYVWGNIFTPCELVHCFGLHTLSIEVLSCYMSGFHLEDYFIDYAQDIGLAPTLCSYHKTFVGGVESGVIQKPDYAITTSLSCDGNLNTFRSLCGGRRVGNVSGRPAARPCRFSGGADRKTV